MKKCAFLIMYISSFLIVTSANLFAQISLPARIGGSVTIDGVQLTQSDGTGYTFTVTRQDSTSYDPAAEDSDGLNNYNWYTIDIPIYDSNNQPDGAQTGETAVIHVFLNGNELSVNSPINGQITVGTSGSISQIDVDAMSTVCVADTITVSTTRLVIKRNESGTITVTVTGADGCAVKNETVTETINAAGKKRISISSTSATTDVNGEATFKITAKKTGSAKVIFRSGSLKKKSITVKVRR